MKKSLPDDLDKVFRRLPSKDEVGTWESAREALFALKKIGGWLLHDLLGTDAGRAHELENFLRYVVPEWRQCPSEVVETWIEPSSNCSRELAEFPFELLPLLDRTLPDPFTSLHGLARAASGLLGFSTSVVRRRESDLFNTSSTFARDRTGQVPVLVFRDHKTLAFVRREIAFIARGTQSFYVVAHWPTEVHPPEEDDLARAMFAPPSSSDAAPQVLHFACHYASNGEFTFADELERRVSITLNDLKAARVRLNRIRRAAPLVFINACESSYFDPIGAMSLLELLREDGAGAVIGSETRVPDGAATLFSRRVYARLAAGQPLGMAVWKARWDIIEERRSVAGILFTLHGRADLRVV